MDTKNNASFKFPIMRVNRIQEKLHVKLERLLREARLIKQGKKKFDLLVSLARQECMLIDACLAEMQKRRNDPRNKLPDSYFFEDGFMYVPEIDGDYGNWINSGLPYTLESFLHSQLDNVQK